MSQDNPHHCLIRERFPLQRIAVAIGAYHLLQTSYFTPLYTPSYGGMILNPPAVAIAAIMGINALQVAEWITNHLSERILLRLGMMSRNAKGSAGWASYKALRPDILTHAKGFAPYWGVYAGSGKRRDRRHCGKPIMASYASNAVTFGTAGSGKGVGSVLPQAFAIRGSKVFNDLKTANVCILKQMLEARGEPVFTLNIGGLFEEIIVNDGDIADGYNPLHVLCDHFERSGGLLLINDDAAEMAMQLVPEPEKGGRDENFYWRQGARDCLSVAIKQVILTHGTYANLGHVHQLLFHQEVFLHDMLWASGQLRNDAGDMLPMPLEQSPWTCHHSAEDVANFIASYRNEASAMATLLSANTSNTAQGFLKGAQQAINPYHPTSRAAKMLSYSSFRFADLKDGAPKSVFIALDASRMANQSRIAALIQWCAYTELKRHPNKHVPVTVIADETTNFEVFGLPSLQTWGREFSIRIHMYIQSLAAYRTVYGENAVNTLLSETEIKQFMPAQRDPEMLELIEKLLGSYSLVDISQNGERGEYGLKGFTLSEQARPLLTADEIRRCTKTILFIRDHKPILTDTPSIASIAPWNKQMGINPYFGTPYILPTALDLRSRYTWREWLRMACPAWIKRRYNRNTTRR